MTPLESFKHSIIHDVETFFGVVARAHTTFDLSTLEKAQQGFYDYYTRELESERGTFPASYERNLHELAERLVAIPDLHYSFGGYWCGYWTYDEETEEGAEFMHKNHIRIYLNPHSSTLINLVPLIKVLMDFHKAKGWDFQFKHVSPTRADERTLRRSDKCVLYLADNQEIFGTVQELLKKLPPGTFSPDVPRFTKKLSDGIAYGLTPKLSESFLERFYAQTGRYEPSTYGAYFSTAIAIALREYAIKELGQSKIDFRMLTPQQIDKAKEAVIEYLLAHVEKDFNLSALGL